MPTDQEIISGGAQRQFRAADGKDIFDFSDGATAASQSTTSGDVPGGPDIFDFSGGAPNQPHGRWPNDPWAQFPDAPKGNSPASGEVWPNHPFGSSDLNQPNREE
jgi:hypothetical protein